MMLSRPGPNNSSDALDPTLVLLFKRVVVFVAAGNVGRQVERRYLAVAVHALSYTDGQQLSDKCACAGRDCPNGTASRQGKSRVAIRRQIVDHHVGDLRQPPAAGMFWSHFRSV